MFTLDSELGYTVFGMEARAHSFLWKLLAELRILGMMGRNQYPSFEREQEGN